MTQTPTATITSTPTSTARPTETATPTPLPTQPAPTPTSTVASAPAGARGNPEDTARNVGLLIGAAVVGSLAVWGIITVVGRIMNARGTRGGGSHVE
jgi:hypothetical protein